MGSEMCIRDRSPICDSAHLTGSGIGTNCRLPSPYFGIDACFADGSAADYASPQTTEARGGMRRCKSGIRSAAC